MEKLIPRPCGDCVACCDGYLIGNSHGNQFGAGKSCVFLVEKKCSIYEDRPQTCHDYVCAWSQGLLSDSMKPTISNVMISVETKDKQFLRVIELAENIDEEVYREIKEFTDKHNTYFVKVPFRKIIPIKHE
jgi:Fe-S-cluster containining protein